MRYVVPSIMLAGNTVASITKYVGEQDENTGPSAAPIIISPHTPCFWKPVVSIALDFSEKRNFSEIFSQRLGKIMVKENAIRMIAETVVQNIGGTEMKTLLTLSRKVKSIIETTSDPMMTRGFLLFPTSETEPPIITGSSAKVQGASTVRMPAMNEMISSAICIIFELKINYVLIIIPHSCKVNFTYVIATSYWYITINLTRRGFWYTIGG